MAEGMNKAGQDPAAATPESDTPESDTPESEMQRSIDPMELLERVDQWVAANRTLALLGSFAIGVFLGVLIRD
jgi:hypothetical protein